MVSRQRAPCPVCGAMRAVGPGGMMWWHKGNRWADGFRQDCKGVGQPPKTGQEEYADGN